jgi:hypothetical protein
MSERSVLPSVLGIPPLAAIGLGAVLTAIGVVVDLARIGTLGAVFTICHIAGCVLAVAWVRRNGLFGPMVQPPLLVAVAVPVVVLLSGAPKPGAGVTEQLLVIGAPLVNAFPIMAWATGLALALGALRLITQRPAAGSGGEQEGGRATADREATGARSAASGRQRQTGGSGRGAPRGAARRSASPRRS